VSTHLENVAKGRQCIEAIFNQIAKEEGLGVQNPGWDDKKRNQPDPLTNYLFTFGVNGIPKSIDFVMRELIDCEIDENMRREIESKIRKHINLFKYL